MSLPHDSTSAQLINDAQANSPAAWHKLYHVYSPLVRRWGVQAGLEEADVADIVQDVFVRLTRYLESYEYDKERARFRTWMRVVTRNCIRDLVRSRREKAVAQGGTEAQDRLMQIAAPCRDEEEITSDRDDAFVTQRVLSLIRTDFGEATWQAFWRSTVECESTACIAADLGLTVGAIRQAKCRVLQRLRCELAELK